MITKTLLFTVLFALLAIFFVNNHHNVLELAQLSLRAGDISAIDYVDVIQDSAWRVWVSGIFTGFGVLSLALTIDAINHKK